MNWRLKTFTAPKLTLLTKRMRLCRAIKPATGCQAAQDDSYGSENVQHDLMELDVFNA